MNRQSLLIIIGGFFMAMCVAIVVQLMIAPSSAQNQVAAEVEKTYILVAARALSKGDTLESGDMQWQEWPENSVFHGAIVREDEQKSIDAASGMLRRDLAKGEPMIKAALVPEEAENFLAASLSKGMRAVSITVSSASSVSGFVGPGDYVDVILTYNVKVPRNEDFKEAAEHVVSKSAAQTVLHKVKVLANDQRTTRRDEAKPSKTVTLEVNAKEAEILALAGTMGKLSLALRKIGDDDLNSEIAIQEALPATTDLRLSRVMQELKSGGHAEKNTGASRKIVRIYNGSNASSIKFNHYASY